MGALAFGTDAHVCWLKPFVKLRDRAIGLAVVKTGDMVPT